MNYKKHYENLIETRKQRSTMEGYLETHHIIPKCLGGTNDPENLIQLTAREHYIAHWLLWKITNNAKMAYAFIAMVYYHKNQRKLTAHQFERARKLKSDMIVSEETRAKMSASRKGKKHTEETKEKMRETWKTSVTEEFREKMREVAKSRPPISEETRERLREGWKKRKENHPMTKETKRKISEAAYKRAEEKRNKES